jgi:hypothetical protein
LGQPCACTSRNRKSFGTSVDLSKRLHDKPSGEFETSFLEGTAKLAEIFRKKSQGTQLGPDKPGTGNLI